MCLCWTKLPTLTLLVAPPQTAFDTYPALSLAPICCSLRGSTGMQGSIFRSKNYIYPPPLLKMIFFAPLATRLFLTPIMAFLPQFFPILHLFYSFTSSFLIFFPHSSFFFPFLLFSFSFSPFFSSPFHIFSSK